MERHLFILQRLTALVMAPLVLVHLVVILYAVRTGLTAGAILGRTQGNWGWIIFYGIFVLAVAVHVPIGLRAILIEWTRVGRGVADVVAVLFAVLLLVTGLRSVMAVGGLSW